MVRAPDLHSRLVAILKIGLPLLAIAMLLSLFLFPREERVGPGLIFTEADLEALGEGLRITEPVLTGATRDEDPFRFAARAVIPDAAPPTRATIEDLDGEISFLGGQRFAVTAPVADVDFETQILEATGGVTVVSDDGYRMSAERVVIDLVAGILRAEGDVDGAGPLGTIAAETMVIAPAETGKGRRVFSFGGGVRLVYVGEDEADEEN
jgi:lipopolysaccharide export system protein LptC